MKRIDQTNFRRGHGDCLRACLASILELYMEQVPHFVALGPKWFVFLQRWLAQFGLGAVLLEFADGPNQTYTPPVGYYIANGPSANTSELPPPRGVKHSVIFLNGRMVHDPHPSRAGLLGVDDLIVFTTLDPSRLVGDVATTGTVHSSKTNGCNPPLGRRTRPMFRRFQKPDSRNGRLGGDEDE